jgi:ubiquinone/menaquinone biosynthesis C-methylase UbiE
MAAELGRVRALLRCPRCSRPLEAREGVMACTGCGTRFGEDEVAIDLVSGDERRMSFGARAMHSSFLARIYESFWRPLSLALSTGFSMPARDAEASLVARALGDAAGPWLDVSCGPGGISNRIAARAPERSIVAVDLSRAMLARARVANPDAIRIRADAARLPFEDGAFGAVINLAALDLYPEPARVVKEMARVLAPGGALVASAFLSSDTLLGSRVLRQTLTSTAGIHPLSQQELEDLVARAGLARRDHWRFGRYLLLSAKKPAAREAL